MNAQQECGRLGGKPLPIPQGMTWRTAFFDFGHYWAIGFDWNNLRHAARIPAVTPYEAPSYNIEWYLRQKLLHWFWRKLGAL